MVLVLTVGAECVQEADGRGEGSVRPKGLGLQEVCYRQSRGEVGSWRAPGGESGGMTEERGQERPKPKTGDVTKLVDIWHMSLGLQQHGC